MQICFCQRCHLKDVICEDVICNGVTGTDVTSKGVISEDVIFKEGPKCIADFVHTWNPGLQSRERSGPDMGMLTPLPINIRTLPPSSPKNRL